VPTIWYHHWCYTWYSYIQMSLKRKQLQKHETWNKNKGKHLLPNALLRPADITIQSTASYSKLLPPRNHRGSWKGCLQHIPPELSQIPASDCLSSRNECKKKAREVATDCSVQNHKEITSWYDNIVWTYFMQLPPCSRKVGNDKGNWQN